MSTIALAADGPHTMAPRTRLRITRRGRRVLAALAALPVTASIGAAVLLGGGAAIGSDEPGAPAGTFAEVTVMPGETLWSIAQRIAPQADPREVVSEIVSLNQLQSSAVDAGQSLSLPAAYSTGR